MLFFAVLLDLKEAFLIAVVLGARRCIASEFLVDRAGWARQGGTSRCRHGGISRSTPPPTLRVDIRHLVLLFVDDGCRLEQAHPGALLSDAACDIIGQYLEHALAEATEAIVDCKAVSSQHDTLVRLGAGLHRAYVLVPATLQRRPEHAHEVRARKVEVRPRPWRRRVRGRLPGLPHHVRAERAPQHPEHRCVKEIRPVRLASVCVQVHDCIQALASHHVGEVCAWRLDSRRLKDDGSTTFQRLQLRKALPHARSEPRLCHLAWEGCAPMVRGRVRRVVASDHRRLSDHA
mmetsp:Transcript_6047/g.23967  ORF Transcript_6047/g.23967 Transcript_6047/m.23967 type:complete len:290 (-) Transcript_6047:3249-4118(-)